MDNLKVVQIKGSNATGKTTIMKQLLELNGEDDVTKLRWGDTIYATSLDRIGYVLIGEYSLTSNSGGTDKYPDTVDDIKRAILDSIRWTEHYGYTFAIVFEGMMISTIKTTFYDYLLKMKGEFDIDPIFVILNAEPEGCYERIKVRTGEEPKESTKENVECKCATVIRHAKTYESKYVHWLDVESTPREDMAAEFLRLIGDTWLLEGI